LSEVVLRPDDTLDDILKKVELATIMGTYQSTLTKYRYLRKVWRDNAEEERLLGVSLTGIMDHPVLCEVTDEAKRWLSTMKEYAIEVNKEWSEKLGINQSVAITTVKPSGTVAELVDTASGIHPRFSDFYIRSVRNDTKDPLAQMLIDQGVPNEQDVTKQDTVTVFSFPKRSPDHCVKRDKMTAIQQLEHYRMVRDCWCEHNVSITVYVRDHEWLAVGDWVYNNWDDVGGISFLPYSDHIYKQAPFIEITNDEYDTAVAEFPEVDFDKLPNYEKDDTTTSSHELACSAGSCAIS
jgi:ribonucleoside-diphosphate reductase alpha chain